jgi:hypothetical protein
MKFKEHFEVIVFNTIKEIISNNTNVIQPANKSLPPEIPSTKLLHLVALNAYKNTPAPVDGFELLDSTETLKLYKSLTESVYLLGIRGMKIRDKIDQQACLSLNCGIIGSEIQKSTRYITDKQTLIDFRLKYNIKKNDFIIGIGHSLAGCLNDEFLHDSLINYAVSFNPAIQPKDINFTQFHRRIYTDKDPLYQRIARKNVKNNIEVRTTNETPGIKWFGKLNKTLGSLFETTNAHSIDNFVGKLNIIPDIKKMTLQRNSAVKQNKNIPKNNVSNNEIYEQFYETILHFFKLDISSNIFFYQLKQSLIFQPILEQIEENEKNTVSFEMTILFVFNMIEFITKCNYPNLEYEKLMVIDVNEIVQNFLEEIFYFINKSFGGNSVIDYETLLINMSDGHNIHKKIFNYIFYLGNINKINNLECNDAVECFYKGFIMFLHILKTASSQFYSKYNYDYDNWFYFSNMETLFKLLSKVYVNEKCILNFLINEITDFNMFLDYMKLGTLEKDLENLISDESFKRIHDLYLEEIIANYIPTGSSKTYIDLKNILLLESKGNLNFTKFSSFSFFIEGLYKYADFYQDASKVIFETKFSGLENNNLYLFVMYHVIEWKYSLNNFIQDYDIDIPYINNLLDNLKLLYIKNEYLKTFYYFVYYLLFNSDKKKKENKVNLLFNQIDFQKIINEHNEIINLEN